MGRREGTRLAFKAFLSHRYNAPRVNTYFFDILTSVANVQFEVDVGTKATNVTRLERMIRDADAFIGIFPFPDDVSTNVDHHVAARASRYFRLELDLAVRSRRPAIIFVDARYRNVIVSSQTVTECRFDNQEIVSSGQSPNKPIYLQAFRDFCAKVAGSLRLEVLQSSRTVSRNRVGLLLPPSGRRRPGYTLQQVHLIEKLIHVQSQDTIHFQYPVVLDGDFYRLIGEIDWVVADIGVDPRCAGIVPFLHGQFVPMMRLLRIGVDPDSGSTAPMERTVFGGVEVGYSKDIVRWHNSRALASELEKRLATLYEQRQRISTPEEARAYFLSAAKRKEAVFVSYSGSDRELAEGLIGALKQQFQLVFNYRDKGESIIPGRPWIQEIFERLSASALGIPLYSASYFKSGNCLHEAREMISLRDNGKLRVMPIKLREGNLAIPSWMQDIQYLRLWEYNRPGNVVEKVIQAAASTPQAPFSVSGEIDRPLVQR